MKVIGEVKHDEFICIVNKDEIEKFMNLYYNKMNKICIGDVIDLGAGYDFASAAKHAMQETNRFIESNQKIIKTIMQGISVIGTTEKESVSDN